MKALQHTSGTQNNNINSFSSPLYMIISLPHSTPTDHQNNITSGSGFRKSRLTVVGNCRADHMAPSTRKGWYLLTRGGRTVGIVCLRTKATEFKYCHLL
jgi:hypothetical protein